MAWARHRGTKELQYILELKETGARCNCECISCGEPLTAVNAGKEIFSRRPHFRHPDGMPKDSCVILTARAALAAAFQSNEILHLPRRRRSMHVQGFSGKQYEAWVEHPPETFRIVDVNFADPLCGFLKLDDGREIEVRLVGSTSVESAGNVNPCIEIVVNDAEIAAMPLSEIRKRLVPLMDEKCWRVHWNDQALEAKALQEAYQRAAEALDWAELDDLPADTTPSIRRETLLHKLVKDILHESGRVALPEHPAVTATREISGHLISRGQDFPARWAELAQVALERRLGHIVPDVIATEVNGATLLVEVTVTNSITEERRQRIEAAGYPAVEINIGSMGGTITREGLANFVVNETAAKRWLCHPESRLAVDVLNAQLDDESVKRDALEKAIELVAHDNTAETWSAVYLEAAILMFRARKAAMQRPSPEADLHEEEMRAAAIALRCQGYPEAADPGLYGAPAMILERLLSIRNDTGVGYAESTCWEVINRIRNDSVVLRQWHPIYLMAIKAYRPKVSALQEESIAKWRADVANSIQWGYEMYVRDDRYDRVLGLLFPELAERLAKPQRTRSKGTTLGSGSATKSASASRPSWTYNDLEKLRPGVDYSSRSYFLKGAALERWKRAHPEMAKVWFGKDDSAD
ncbi:hypothetical protein [Massilia sp. H6]|uniref:hypothetical protein n=1 Tax=Massilia sp. H6 TaxID=2970464 RepID=UPI0021684582|nr:hypothetical protein [Massilia sp. H6]UVW30725.1 hypothetical protein NRS07_20020 [Massilia sp. H6]